jgi:plastocyanin
MRKILHAAVLAIPFVVVACGAYNSPTPVPDGGPPAGADVVINVISENGAQSFSPNPATIPAGKTVVWHNVDRTVHHVVLDDGRLDAGNLNPGQYSAPMTLPAPGPYHCTIHPNMVGRLQ